MNVQKSHLTTDYLMYNRATIAPMVCISCQEHVKQPALRIRTVSETVPKLFITKIHDVVKTIREIDVPKSLLTTDYFMYNRTTVMQMACFCWQYHTESLAIKIRTVSLMVPELLITKNP